MGFSESMESLKGFDPNDIDFNNAGSWPVAVKTIVIAFVFLALLIGGYFFMIQEQYTELDRVAADEASLKQQYESRAYKVANLDAFRLQMEDMKKSFGVLLKQLPAKTEVPGLLEDITNTGLGSGLDIESIQLKQEVSKEFYVELPMEIRVAGTYHDIASFVSGVASLPRIVTLHDMTVSKLDGNFGADNKGRDSHKLQMSVEAKTYRYGTEADRAKASKSKKKGRRR